MPKIYIVSDTHFDRRMCPLNEGKELTRRFQYTNPDYVESVIADWESRVTAEDTVIHIGDVMGGRITKAWLQKIKSLPGYKILVRGNHDQASREKWLTAFDEVHDRYYIKDSVVYCHYPTDPAEHECKYNVHGHLHSHPKRLSDPLIQSYRNFYRFEQNYGFVLADWGWGLAEEEALLKRAFQEIYSPK